MFIGTYSKTMATRLKQSGYPLIKEFNMNGKAIFLFKNINKLSFNESDSKEVFYTNKMSF